MCELAKVKTWKHLLLKALGCSPCWNGFAFCSAGSCINAAFRISSCLVAVYCLGDIAVFIAHQDMVFRIVGSTTNRYEGYDSSERNFLLCRLEVPPFGLLSFLLQHDYHHRHDRHKHQYMLCDE